jgi:hypothetical protein
MVRNPATVSSSLDETLKEAKEFGASADEARKIHEMVHANTSPDFIRTFELKFGPDSENNRAVWVHLIVDSDLKPSEEKISELNKIANRVRTALLGETLNLRPYVDFRGRL